MILRKWEDLPEKMKTEEVRKYYDILEKKKVSLFLKRMFDVVVSAMLLVVFLPVFLILATAIKIDSSGPIFYRQVRVTRYGEYFRIFKFRTMVSGADKIGSLVTVNNDNRITKVGSFIRKFRLDELSQLLDVFRGTMTFVGTRPEVPKYTEQYTAEMMATFLLPAGVTGLACVFFKDEAKMLDGVADADEIYVKEILPQKMYYNLEALEGFSIQTDIKIMFMTIMSVLGKKYTVIDMKEKK